MAARTLGEIFTPRSMMNHCRCQRLGIGLFTLLLGVRKRLTFADIGRTLIGKLRKRPERNDGINVCRLHAGVIAVWQKPDRQKNNSSKENSRKDNVYKPFEYRPAV